MNIYKIPGCRECAFRDHDYYCREGGQRAPEACRPALFGQPAKPHVVPDWCPVLEATMRGRHVMGAQIRIKPGGGKSFCEFVYCADAPICERHVYIKDW